MDTRINAAAREHGMSYSCFIHKLNKSDISLNRKTISNLAAEDPGSFKVIIETIKNS